MKKRPALLWSTAVLTDGKALSSEAVLIYCPAMALSPATGTMCLLERIVHNFSALHLPGFQHTHRSLFQHKQLSSLQQKHFPALCLCRLYEGHHPREFHQAKATWLRYHRENWWVQQPKIDDLSIEIVIYAHNMNVRDPNYHATCAHLGTKPRLPEFSRTCCNRPNFQINPLAIKKSSCAPVGASLPAA